MDEIVAHLVMSRLRLINFAFFTILVQILRTTQKATLTSMLCSGQAKTEPCATTSERVVLNETACIASVLPEVLPCPTETVQVPDQNKCDQCELYIRRLEQVQDSCRKYKQRRAVLEMEVRQVRKVNKELQKVTCIDISLRYHVF